MSPSLILRVAPFVFVLAVACKRQPEPGGRQESEGPRPTASSSSGNTGAAPEAFLAPKPGAAPPTERHAEKVADLRWTDPPGWTRAPSPSAMRLATYRVPKAKGDPEDGEMTVFHFGAGNGGGIDANFDRWVSQFHGLDRSRALRTERTVQGLTEHVLEIVSGSFAASMRPGEPDAPKSQFGLLGAIVETPGGAYFFKLTGPTKTLRAARDAFFGLLDSVNQP